MHTHLDEQGKLIKCYHECKSALTDWKFLLGFTLGFPIEHWIWEKIPGFSHITAWMGL